MPFDGGSIRSVMELVTAPQAKALAQVQAQVKGYEKSFNATMAANQAAVNKVTTAIQQQAAAVAKPMAAAKAAVAEIGLAPRAAGAGAAGNAVPAWAQALAGGAPNIAAAAKAATAPAMEAAGKASADSYVGGFLSDLNAVAGKRSLSGKLMKVMMGGGAIGALGMAASQFNELTKKAEEFALALNKGPTAAREATAELLKSIPVAGKIAEGIVRVGELLDGTASYVARIRQEAQNIDAVTDSWARGTAIVAEHAKSVTAAVAEEARIRGLIGKGPIETAAMTAAQEFQRKSEAAREEAKKAQESIAGNKDQLKTLADLNSQLINMQAPERYQGVSSWTVAGGWEMAGTRYQRELADFNQQQQTLQMQIAAITGRQGKDVAAIQFREQENITAAAKTMWAKQWQDVKGYAADAAGFAGNVWGKAMEDAGRKIEEQRKKVEEINKPLEDLRRDLATFGLSDIEKRLYDFKNLPGVAADQVAQYEAMSKQLATKEIAASFEQAVKDAAAGPNSGMSEAVRGLKGAKAFETQLTPLIRAGSQEANRYKADLEMRRLQENWPQKQLAATEKTNTKLDAIVHALDFDIMEIPK